MTQGHNSSADPAIHVRAARSDDAPTIVDFNYSLAFETEDIQLDREVLRKGVRRALDDPTHLRYFMAVRVAGNRQVADRVVGQLGITTEWSDWRNAYLWWIQSVYVIPSERRGGVYGILHNHVLAQARCNADVCGIRLCVHNANDGAMATYRKVGMSASDYQVFEQLWDGAH